MSGTFLGRLPRGEAVPERDLAEVLRDLLERIDDETNPLAVLARAELAKLEGGAS